MNSSIPLKYCLLWQLFLFFPLNRRASAGQMEGLRLPISLYIFLYISSELFDLELFGISTFPRPRLRPHSVRLEEERALYLATPVQMRLEKRRIVNLRRDDLEDLDTSTQSPPKGSESGLKKPNETVSLTLDCCLTQ